ncbi:hypothetical protein AYO44_13490 [Planctomycetaceae bacterium SCGC AG-212-F19]|nr:hypothetical protein AYO44_13490 [Planctomycetaceae bacterium SCGC AG-212-F19]
MSPLAKDVVGFATCFGVLVAILWFMWAIGSREVRHFWIRRQGTPTIAAIVQANTELFGQGIEDQPAQVIFTLDKSVARPVPFLESLAKRMGEFKTKEPTDGEEQELAGLVRSERYRPRMCQLLPTGFTAGAEAYTCHVMIYRSLLPGGFLGEMLVACKAIAGPWGGAVMIAQSEVPE